MAKKKNEVVPAAQIKKDLAQPLRGLGRGLEEVEQRDVQLGRLKLLQKTSDKELSAIKGSKVGDIINNISLVNYGNKLTITPLFLFKSRAKWEDREEGNKIECQAPDGKIPTTHQYAKECSSCPHRDWAKNKAGATIAPLCTEYYNFAVLVNEETLPVVLSCDRSKIKVARKLISMMMMASTPENPTPDMWSRQYALISKEEINPKGNFTNFIPSLKGETPDKIKKLAESLYLSLKKVKINVKDEEQPSPAPK